VNERIKQLAEQTGFRYDNGEWHFSDDSDVEKFAELIVRECADACYKHKDVERFGIYPIRVAIVTKACSDNIKEHFGVEE
jgi:uncharacterized protein (DUF924 family)